MSALGHNSVVGPAHQHSSNGGLRLNPLKSRRYLLCKANALEARAERLCKQDSPDAALQAQSLFQEVQNLREWAEFGCLIGRPHSTWSP